MENRTYPIVVIGAGAAGLVVAIGCARAGKQTLLIEKGNWGGDCTNFGCIPSKTLIAAAQQRLEGSDALRRVRKIVAEVRSHEDPEALQKIGVETLTATASFLGSDLIEAKTADGRTLHIRSEKIVIATGSLPEIPSISGLAGTPFLTNETIFTLEKVPKKLIVLGGGPIGCELSQAFGRLGAEVELVHRHEDLLGREPHEASVVLKEQFKREGIRLHLGSQCERVEYRSGLFHCILSDGKRIEGDQLLISIGRKPALGDLNLDKAGIAYSAGGIDVDAYGRTSQKHIFAIGDAVGPPFFTHLAENRARSVLTTLLLAPWWKKKIDSKQPVPRVTYTDPEVASVGISEEEAIKKYGAGRVAVYVVPMSEVDRAITQQRIEGFVKVVTKRWSSRILGATIVAPRAGEMLSEITTAMHAELPLRKLAGLIHAYPTYNLAIRRAADLWLTQTILPIARRLRWKK